MEETIGYEALLSAQEWESLGLVDWPEHDPTDPDRFSSGVTLLNGEGVAALSPSVASEETNSPSLVPSAASLCDEEQKRETQDDHPIHLEFVHEVSCRTRDLDDGSSEYVLECDICEEIGVADDYEEADVIAQQHKTATVEWWVA